MINFSIKSNMPAVLAQIEQIGKQVRFAAAVALTKTAVDVSAAETAEMSAVFDRPTPFTLGSLRVVQARRDSLEAVVETKDAGPGGRSAEKWLSIEAAGGPRRLTGAERALRAAGILPANRYVVPSTGAELDAYGNWKRSQLTRILLDLRMNAGAAPSRRLTALQARDALRGRRTLSRYFVLREHNKGLKPGIYERRVSALGHAVRPVVLFTSSAPRYKVRLPFGQAGLAVAQEKFAGYFDQALTTALETAR